MLTRKDELTSMLRNQVDLGTKKLTLSCFVGKSEGRQPTMVYLDNDCLRHMTGDKSNFLSLTAFEGGSVAFENNKTRKIVVAGKIGKSHSHSIDNVYLVDGLKHNLLSVS